jgi:uncharacterized protein
VTERVLADTGPLVAIWSNRDPRHSECVEQIGKMRPPLITCWPVLTEAAWLLRDEPVAIQRLLAGFDEGLLHLEPLGERAIEWVAEFLVRYQDLGAQLADASLMYLAEREDINTIFTLDLRDFGVYRRANGRPLRILPLEDGA